MEITENSLSKRMQTLRLIEKICAVFIFLFVLCAVIVFGSLFFGMEIELPESLLFIFKWGMIISLILLIVSAGIEFISALKQNQ